MVDTETDPLWSGGAGPERAATAGTGPSEDSSAPRLRLRPVRREDLDTLERWWESPEVQGRFNWFGHPPPEFLRRRFEENGMLGEEYGHLLVELADGTLVGDVSYHAVKHGPGGGSVAYNVGITLLPEHRSQGLGTEAQRLLAEYLFAHTRVERVEAGTDVENVAEQRALEKAGFTREGVLRRAQFRDGAFHDMLLYSRLRGE
ncbi:MAG TPA: GNAT family protein [Actinomycetes bacterium]